MRTKITTNLFWMSAMFVIAVITYVVVYTYEVQDEALTYQRWVDHSREVLLTTEKITGTFESTLAEQRGYLLTADKAFEEGFRIKGKTVVASLDKLSALTKDNFEQHAWVEQLQDIADEGLLHPRANRGAKLFVLPCNHQQDGALVFMRQLHGTLTAVWLIAVGGHIQRAIGIGHGRGVGNVAQQGVVGLVHKGNIPPIVMVGGQVACHPRVCVVLRCFDGAACMRIPPA